MKIKRKGNSFVAYVTEKSEIEHEGQKIGDERGRVSITTGRFSGATGFMTELYERLEKHLKPIKEKQQQLTDNVIEQFQKDITVGDVTAIEELLKFVPEENLKAYLPE